MSWTGQKGRDGYSNAPLANQAAVKKEKPKVGRSINQSITLSFHPPYDMPSHSPLTRPLYP